MPPEFARIRLRSLVVERETVNNAGVFLNICDSNLEVGSSILPGGAYLFIRARSLAWWSARLINVSVLLIRKYPYRDREVGSSNLPGLIIFFL